MNKLHQDVIDSQIRRYLEELESFKTQIRKDVQIPPRIRVCMCVRLDSITFDLEHIQFKNNLEWLCDTQQ